MKRLLSLLVLVAAAGWGQAAAPETGFSFGTVPSGGDWANDDAVRAVLAKSDTANLAFVVALGVKRPSHPCTDTIYMRRKELLDSSKHGLVITPAATDWAECEGAGGLSTAAGKLTRLRELLFADEFSFGATRIPLVRQSTEAKFHSFVENTRWEIGDVMFATVNLPANNNHFVAAAGRNGEFEDRLVANREWLRRVFTYAALKKRDAVVLFSDANPLARSPGVRRDGYAETRRHLFALSSRFKGKVLIVHAQPTALDTASAISWRGNIGEIGIARGWTAIAYDPGRPARFAPAMPRASSNGRQ